jgi:hypothetical protein
MEKGLICKCGNNGWKLSEIISRLKSAEVPLYTRGVDDNHWKVKTNFDFSKTEKDVFDFLLTEISNGFNNVAILGKKISPISDESLGLKAEITFTGNKKT